MKLTEKVKEELRTRHYAYRTEKTYFGYDWLLISWANERSYNMMLGF
jgi:hypothetical protein